MKRKKNLMKDKRNNGMHSLEPQKAHLTGEFAVVPQLGQYDASFGI